jgi:hypothetical protein
MDATRSGVLARVAFCLALVVACGRVEPGDAAGAAGAAGLDSEVSPDVRPLLPWQVGNSWSYRVTKTETGIGLVVSEKTTTVGPLEAVGGMGANAELLANLVTTIENDASYTESWQGPLGSNLERILRFRERDFAGNSPVLDLETFHDPGKLHVDSSAEHTLEGATWIEETSETKLEPGYPPHAGSLRERWAVLDDDETITVPAGTFEGVVHLQKVGSSTKEYWYAHGVGKLKEQGRQLEELVSYQLEP